MRVKELVMKERTMKKVFKGVAILFGGMFLYGVITIGAMIAKYGLHFGYVSDGSIELIGGLITIAVILGASMAGGTPSRSGDDEVDFGDEMAKGWMGDMSSRYYMMFDND